MGDIEDSDEEDLIGYDAIEPGLPPASSDKQKWWLDNRQPARAQVTVPNGRDGLPMVLNPQRPSNPFGLSEDQDWVSVTRSDSKTSLSSISSSPYEKVNLPSRMQSSASARKLPPAFNQDTLPARVGRMNLGEDQSARMQIGMDGPPPPPPPRRQTAGISGRPNPPSSQMSLNQEPLQPMSAASTGQRNKAGAPPVARKPAHLTGGSSQPQSPMAMAMSARDGTETKPPLPSRSSTTGSQQPGAVRMPGMGGGPALPARKAVGTPSRQEQEPPGDLLDSLDDDGRGVGTWETLQPSRS